MTMTVVPVISHVPLNFVVDMFPIVCSLIGACYVGRYLLPYFRCQLCVLLYAVLAS